MCEFLALRRTWFAALIMAFAAAALVATGHGHVLASVVLPALQDLTVSLVPISQIRSHVTNARTHSKAQIRQLAESMKRFGWTFPILLDAKNRIIAGHARLEAAKLLGLTEIPVLRRSDLSEAQIRAYCIADNKLAEGAGWDAGLLKLEFEEIIKLDPSFDISVTGFTFGELDVVLDQGAHSRADQIPEFDPDEKPTNRVGDLWTLGAHRFLCGDARDPAAYAKLMGGQTAQMVFTDPPWNIPIEGNVGGLGSIKHRDFVMGVGEMSQTEYIEFLASIIVLLIANSAKAAIHFIAMDWRHIFELTTAARGRYSELKNLCVWNKTNGGMGSFYRSKHELIFAFKNGSGRHINNIDLGRNGRNRSNVWDYPGATAPGTAQRQDLRLHPTAKPVALVADAIKDCSKRRGIILDPFLGSGTTLVAAELVPEGPTRAYLLVIDRNPKAVQKALRVA